MTFVGCGILLQRGAIIPKTCVHVIATLLGSRRFATCTWYRQLDRILRVPLYSCRPPSFGVQYSTCSCSTEVEQGTGLLYYTEIVDWWSLQYDTGSMKDVTEKIASKFEDFIFLLPFCTGRGSAAYSVLVLIVENNLCSSVQVVPLLATH